MTSRPPRARPRAVVGLESGMTLTELLVASALLSVVIIAGYLLLEAAVGMVDFAEAQSRVSEETRSAMDRMTLEIRQASELPGQDGAGVFSQVSTSQVAFYADVDHEGQLERVSYRRSGSKLLRSVTEPTFVDGDYTFGAPGPDSVLASGLPVDWQQPVFVTWARKEAGTADRQLTPAEMAYASAISIHLRNSLTVGRRTAVSDDQTWVKIRSVQNAVN